MPGLVEIAVGHERQAFQAHVVEDVVAVGDFPRVQQRGELLLVLPEIQRVLAPLAFHDVRMRGHGERTLPVDLLDDVRDVERGGDGRLQVNAEQMRGAFAGVAVLVELDAGQDEHLVTAPRALALAFDDGKVFANLFLRERHVGQLGQFAEQPLRIGQMVGDADAVEPAFAVEVNHLRHGEFAVGIIGVDVEIAQEHLRTACAVSTGKGRGTHDAVGRGFKQFDVLASRPVLVGGFQDEFADAQGGVGPGDVLEIGAPLVPLRGLFDEGVFDQFGHFPVLLANRAKMIAPDEFGVALLLAGDDLIDNHRAAGGDGLLHRRAAGLGNDQMVAHQQLRHLVRPADDLHAVFEAAGAFDELGAQFGVAPDRDGEVDVVQFEEPVHRLAGLLLSGVDDVKDAARFAAHGRGKISGLSANTGLTGKPSV